jgi:glycosyltransferase involved in cell wall biosynthesis
MNGPNQSGAPRSGAVLAVVPAHNEAPRVARVIRGTREHLPTLVVDDGSADATAEAATQAGARVLALTPNRGKGAALRAGFRVALDEGYDAVLTLDADGQHDPAEIPAFLSVYAQTRADLVVGARDFRRMPPVRRLSNTLGRWIFSLAVGRRIVDNQSGYRLVSRRLLEAVIASDERGFAFEVEMIAVCIARGYELRWVPIRTIYAGETSHIRPWQHATSFLDMARRARRIVKAGPPAQAAHRNAVEK